MRVVAVSSSPEKQARNGRASSERASEPNAQHGMMALSWFLRILGGGKQLSRTLRYLE